MYIIYSSCRAVFGGGIGGLVVITGNARYETEAAQIALHKVDSSRIIEMELNISILFLITL